MVGVPRPVSLLPVRRRLKGASQTIPRRDNLVVLKFVTC